MKGNEHNLNEHNNKLLECKTNVFAECNLGVFVECRSLKKVHKNIGHYSNRYICFTK